MKIIIVLPDHNYFLWQMLVQINNFIKYGYDEDTVYVVSSSNPSVILKSLMSHPKIKSKFYIYNDDDFHSVFIFKPRNTWRQALLKRNHYCYISIKVLIEYRTVASGSRPI